MNIENGINILNIVYEDIEQITDQYMAVRFENNTRVLNVLTGELLDGTLDKLMKGASFIGIGFILHKDYEYYTYVFIDKHTEPIKLDGRYRAVGGTSKLKLFESSSINDYRQLIVINKQTKSIIYKCKQRCLLVYEGRYCFKQKDSTGKHTNMVITEKYGITSTEEWIKREKIFRSVG